MQYGFVIDRRGRDLAETIRAGVETEGVIVVPGAFFDTPSAFRMSWTIAPDRLDEGLVRLGRALGLETRP
jgi:aspartate/methionine/tyrosine aminotransferase